MDNATALANATQTDTSFVTAPGMLTGLIVCAVVFGVCLPLFGTLFLLDRHTKKKKKKKANSTKTTNKPPSERAKMWNDAILETNNSSSQPYSNQDDDDEAQSPNVSGQSGDQLDERSRAANGLSGRNLLYQLASLPIASTADPEASQFPTFDILHGHNQRTKGRGSVETPNSS